MLYQKECKELGGDCVFVLLVARMQELCTLEALEDRHEKYNPKHQFPLKLHKCQQNLG